MNLYVCDTHIDSTTSITIPKVVVSQSDLPPSRCPRLSLFLRNGHLHVYHIKEMVMVLYPLDKEEALMATLWSCFIKVSQAIRDLIS